MSSDNPTGDPTRDSPHDSEADEPLGPFTPDDESPGGSTPEVHDGITPHDLPKNHPGRQEAERQEAETGEVKGNV